MFDNFEHTKVDNIDGKTMRTPKQIFCIVRTVIGLSSTVLHRWDSNVSCRKGTKMKSSEIIANKVDELRDGSY